MFACDHWLSVRWIDPTTKSWERSKRGGSLTILGESTAGDKSVDEMKGKLGGDPRGAWLRIIANRQWSPLPGLKEEGHLVLRCFEASSPAILH
jgi:hypothetical protein